MDKNGYGEIRLNRGAYTSDGPGGGRYDSGTHFAHRVALEVLGGAEVSDTDVVRHSCDRPDCCNYLNHLLVGTQADNVRDMIERGRQTDYSWILVGENHPLATITDKIAIAIFNARGPTHRAIGLRFGVSTTLVQHIKSGKTWSAVTGADPTPPGLAVGERHGHAKLTESDIRVIRSSTDLGRILAARFGVSEVMISRIRNGLAWTHVTD